MKCKECSENLELVKQYQKTVLSVVRNLERVFATAEKIKKENEKLADDLEYWMHGRREYNTLEKKWEKLANIPKNKRTKKQIKNLQFFAEKIREIEYSLDKQRIILSNKIVTKWKNSNPETER